MGPVSALLDTSMLVRYLTGDPPDLADASAKVIDAEAELLISDVALVETAYVLASAYGVPRDERFPSVRILTAQLLSSIWISISLDISQDWGGFT